MLPHVLRLVEVKAKVAADELGATEAFLEVAVSAVHILADDLIKLQKQVVNANWRNLREARAGRSMDALAKDVTTVHDSQGVNLENLEKALEEVEDPEVGEALAKAQAQMKLVQEQLKKTPSNLLFIDMLG
jgi:hypothetical protein